MAAPMDCEVGRRSAGPGGGEVRERVSECPAGWEKEGARRRGCGGRGRVGRSGYGKRGDCCLPPRDWRASVYTGVQVSEAWEAEEQM